MNILLVDDHALFRAGLRLLLRSTWSAASVWDAASIADAVAIAEGPVDMDVCLLDLAFPGDSGFAGLVGIKRAAPRCAMVVVSASDDGATIRACLDCGAMSFIPKNLGSTELMLALQTVMAGAVYLPHQVQKALHHAGEPPVLTRRQRDVLGGLGRALPTKLIARELGISENTVKEYAASLYHALGVHSRTEAVIVAHRLHLFDAPAR